MKLKNLLHEIGVEFNEDIDVKGITCDSRKVKKGYLFIAIKGNTFNGNDYVDKVINKCSYVISDSISGDKILYIQNIDELKATLFYSFYNNPQDKLKIVGVTGTNGKTSTSMILYKALNKLGKKCMYIGTLGVYDNDYFLNTNNTTPDCEILAQEFYKAVKRKTKYVAMEVSSHSISMNRISNISFTGAVFTNLTHEHLDYHKTMDNYFLTKKKLFDSLGGESFAIINSDDQSSNAIISKCIAKIVKYGVTSSENNISNISRSLDGVSFNLGKYEGVKSKLLGLVNIYNISAAILCLIELGVKENILSTIEDIDTINGRLEKIYSNKFNIIVDYAHTPDAMEKVLLEVKPLVHNKLITLFGCGGNRDKSKRSLMGNIASKYSDIVYITSDNPRNEDPFEIITNIKNGCLNDKNIIIECDRNKAIINALSNMNNGDLLMVLGKGHEEYQIIKDKKIEFIDKKIIKTWLQI